MIYARLLTVILMTAVPVPQVSPSKLVTHSVCDVLDDRQTYNNKEVQVEALLVASQHGAVLQGKTCGEGIYISHEAGRKDGNWPAFDEAIVKKASGLETAPLHVELRGLFRNRVPYGKSTIRQIEVHEVLSVMFLPKPTDTDTNRFVYDYSKLFVHS